MAYEKRDEEWAIYTWCLHGKDTLCRISHWILTLGSILICLEDTIVIKIPRDRVPIDDLYCYWNVYLFVSHSWNNELLRRFIDNSTILIKGKEGGIKK